MPHLTVTQWKEDIMYIYIYTIYHDVFEDDNDDDDDDDDDDDSDGDGDGDGDGDVWQT